MLPQPVIGDCLGRLLSDMTLSLPEKFVIEEPKNPDHGDLSTNVALLLAKQAGRSPRELAADIASKLPAYCNWIEKVNPAGPGFINMVLKPEFWRESIHEVERGGMNFGHSSAGGGKKSLVEYVSANPTGPLHVGHGRGAALGDSLTRILRAAGYDVATEYYLNDAGRQMRLLGASIYGRLMELANHPGEFPEDGYKGDYIAELAEQLLKERPEIPHLPPEAGREICQAYGQQAILDGIKDDLTAFDCEHQNWFSERSLVDNGAVERTFRSLANSGKSFEKDGALWFDSMALGDDQNRVLKKSDGSLTYFATDIAYHKDKFDRGHEWLIDIWGADHHGYIPRMKAAIEAMGQDRRNLEVVLVQLVTLLKNGERIPMSTRAGKFVTLAEVIEEVGKDAARFMFLSRSPDSPLDFDLELAKKRTMDNPVYYVQYGHARIMALLRRAAEQGIELPQYSDGQILASLDRPEDLAILRQIAIFESVVANAASALAPHHISRYLMELAAKLHSYYGKYTIIDQNDLRRTMATLALFRAAGQVLRNGLDLLGVSAPDTM